MIFACAKRTIVLRERAKDFLKTSNFIPLCHGRTNTFRNLVPRLLSPLPLHSRSGSAECNGSGDKSLGTRLYILTALHYHLIRAFSHDLSFVALKTCSLQGHWILSLGK